MRILIGALAAILLAGPATAQAMNAETFYQRAIKLQKKGAMAIFSGGEIKALMNEAKAAGQHAREKRLAAVKAGQKARYCPPDKPVSMNNKEFMAGLSAIPASERQRIDMTEAMTRILEVKYPCRG